MSTIDLNREIVRNFWSMQNGQPYVLTAQAWEQYQAARVQRGWGRTTANRQELQLVRSGYRLMCGNSLIWDFVQNPNPGALTLTLAFALALASTFAFALACCAFAFAFAFALEPAGLPDSPTPIPPPIPDEFGQFVDLQTNSQAEFWRETKSGFRLAGAVEPNGKIQLHLRDLPEEVAAKILAIVSGLD